MPPRPTRSGMLGSCSISIRSSPWEDLSVSVRLEGGISVAGFGTGGGWGPRWRWKSPPGWRGQALVEEGHRYSQRTSPSLLVDGLGSSDIGKEDALEWGDDWLPGRD